MSYGKAYKNWISDRLSNGEVEKISIELEQIYQNVAISYVWKWSTLESIYKSPNFVEFLYLNKERLKEDKDFIRRIYEISVTTNFIELKKGFETSKSQRLYFNWYVKPSFRLVYLIDFFCSNTDCINEKNRYYIVKILEESTKLLPIFKDKLISRIPNAMSLICLLIEELREIRYYDNKQLIKGIRTSFFSYAPYFIDVSKKMLLKIINEDKCSFDHDFIQSILVLSSNIEESVFIPIEFIKAFYTEIIYIYREKSIHVEDSSSFYHMDIEHEEIFNINDSLSHVEPYSFKTQFYVMLKVDFNKTLDFVIEFINEKCKSCYDNQKRLRYYSVGLIDFKFRNHSTKIYSDGNHYTAYRGGTNVPGFLVCILMSLERTLLEKTEVEDIANILEKIIVESNNLMLIGVVMSIIIKDYKKYGSIFIDLLPNYYLRNLEIQRYINESTNLRFPTRDHFAKADRNEYDKLPHRKEQFDNVLIYVQQIDEFRESVFFMIDCLKSQLNEDDKQYVEKYNFLHNKDLRNFVYTGKQDDYIVYNAKEIEQKDVKEELDKERAYLDLFSEYSKLNNILMSNNMSSIDIKEANVLIKNYRAGKYNSVNKYMIDELEVSITLFYILNPDFLTLKQYESEVQKCIDKALSVASHDIYAFGRLVIIFTKVFLNLNENCLNKFYNEILYFFFIYLIKNTAQSFGISEVCSMLRSHNGIASDLIKRLVKLLIRYLEYDKKSFKIQQRMSLREVISIDELNASEKSHKIQIVKLIKSGVEPVLDGSKGYCPNRMYLVYPIANIANYLTWDLVSEVLLKLIKQLKQNEYENWVDRERVYFDLAASQFIAFGINNNIPPRKLMDYIYLNLTMFHKIVGEVIDTLSAYVQDGILKIESGWAYMNEAVSNLASYEGKANLITYRRNGFIKNIDDLNLGQLLEKLLLSNSKWINQLKPDKIKIIEGHENEFIDLILNFIDSPVAFRIFAENFVNHPKQFDCILIFKYFESLLEVAKNSDIYNENNLLWYWESVIELVFNKYNDLNATNRDQFYELLTTIGCNAPSSFALFLRQKIEY